MKIDPVNYRVIVKVAIDEDCLFVTAFNIDANKKHVGFDFVRKIFQIPHVGITIPSDRQASFKEELLCTNESSEVSQQERSKDVQFIEQKLKEVYGTDAIIRVEKI